MLHYRPVGHRPSSGLLICFISQTSPLDASTVKRSYSRYKKLIEAWESFSLPMVFVDRDIGRSGYHGVNGDIRPRPGDMVFEPTSASLFRDRKFLNFDADLGRPPLVFAGADLDGMILASAVDGTLSGRTIFVAADAVTVNSANLREAQARLVTTSIVAQFAISKTTLEIINRFSGVQ